MSTKYPGGYITSTPPTPSLAAAPGIWTLDQAAEYVKQDSWPGMGIGYLFMQGESQYGATDRNVNYNATNASNIINQTLYYGPWNSWAKPGGAPTTASFLVKDDGTLWGVGNTIYGMSGQNIFEVTPVFINLPFQIGTLTDWKNAKICVGTYSVYAIKENGTLWAWGYNTSGQLGDGTTISRSSPVQIGAGTTWQNISAGDYFCIATRTDGTLWAWGENANGQLGKNNRTNYSSPVQVGALTDWGNASLAAGITYWAAVKADGTMWSCGANTNGRLGLNIAATQSRSSPVQIGISAIWDKVFSSQASTFAITKAGALWAWGLGTSGELGTSSIISRSSPVQVGALTNWKTIFGRGSGAAIGAIKTDGTLWGWGSASFPFDPGSASSPVQIGSDTDWDEPVAGYQVGALNGKVISSIYAQLIFKTSKDYPYGSAQSWGIATAYKAPTVGSTWPVLINQNKWKSVATDGIDTAAITSSGTLWTWGYSQLGQSGNNSTIARSSPVQVGSLTNWSQVSLFQSVYAVKTDGTLWAWGFNNVGQLAQNDTVARSSPVQIGALTTWAEVQTGFEFVIARSTNGSIWSWGKNTDGALGQNIATTINRSSPVQIGALTTWQSISAGGTVAGAIKTDGTLWMWGRGDSGALGQNANIYRSSPVQVGALTNWKKISISPNTGSPFCVAIKTDGTLWSWGTNSSGQLGDNTRTSRSSPVQIGSNTNWADCAAGDSTTYAITTSGALYVFGFASGATASGSVAFYRSSPVQVGAESYYLKVFSSTRNQQATAIFLTNDY